MGDYARKAEDYMSKAQKKLNVRSRSPLHPHPLPRAPSPARVVRAPRSARFRARDLVAPARRAPSDST